MPKKQQDRTRQDLPKQNPVGPDRPLFFAALQSLCNLATVHRNIAYTACLSMPSAPTERPLETTRAPVLSESRSCLELVAAWDCSLSKFEAQSANTMDHVSQQPESGSIACIALTVRIEPS